MMEETCGSALEAHYSPGLVVLSIAMGCLVAYGALGVADRIIASDNAKLQRNWLAAGAVILGIGVWAMHFIAMLALKLPIAVSYDILVTILSTLPVILASGVMLYVISRPKIKRSRCLPGGTLMGAGIGAMHYVGMAAMSGVGQQLLMMYDPKLFVVSVIVAVVLANAALFINSLVGRKKEEGNALWGKLNPLPSWGLPYPACTIRRWPPPISFRETPRPAGWTMCWIPTRWRSGSL